MLARTVTPISAASFDRLGRGKVIACTVRAGRIVDLDDTPILVDHVSTVGVDAGILVVVDDLGEDFPIITQAFVN